MLFLVTASWGHGGTSSASGSKLEVENAWARPTIAAGRMTAAYFDLKNPSKEALTLISIELDIGDAEIHESLIEDGVMRMRHRSEIRVAPGESLHFTPGGLHVMLMNLKQPLVLGETFSMKLKTKDNLTIPVQVQIRQL